MATSKVTLRRKDIKDNKESLYLDFYPPVRNSETMKMSRREFLGIYIYKNPKDAMQRDFNNDMLDKAEAVRCMRQQAIINEEYGFLDKNKMKSDFLAFFKKQAIDKDQKWQMVYSHFERFVEGQCTFGEINVDLCRRFRDYLLKAKQMKNDKLTISRNSAAGYFSTFRALLKIAYRDKYIRENINDFLDKIDYEEVRKEYLTLEEVKLLVATKCEIDVLKRASIFSCLTGLRISDILKLDWSEIKLGADNGYCMRIRTEKTDTETTLPISNEALDFCGERDEGLVFKGLLRSMTQYPLKKWIKSAGIDRRITFHCFRHTFAVLQIAMGTEIYTVSKMMTHKNVSTTQIYAELVSEKKRESANRITLK